MINKKITDSLQSKKRVSFEKSYGKETLKLRDSVIIDPSSICLPQHSVLTRRSIADLFSEFNVSDPFLPSTSSDQATKLPELHPLKLILTPVQEEIESNQSSGHHNHKPLNQAQPNLLPITSFISPSPQVPTKLNPSALKSEVKTLETKLEEYKKDLLDYQRHYSKLASYADIIQYKLKILNEFKPTRNIIQEFIENSKSSPSLIDFLNEPYREIDRWKFTYKDQKDLIEFYAHKGTFAVDTILDKLVMGLNADEKGIIMIKFELFDRFASEEVQEVWRSYSLFVAKKLALDCVREVLEKASKAWVNFVVFTSRYEILCLSLGRYEVFVQDRCILMKGVIGMTNWEYTLTYYGISEGVDIFDDFCSTFKSII